MGPGRFSCFLKLDNFFVGKSCPVSKNPKPTRTHFLPPAAGPPYLDSPPPRLAPCGGLVAQFEPQCVHQGAKNQPDRWQKNPTGFFDSGHSVTRKDMSFIPLNPRNLSMVVDHNENNLNFTN